MKRTLTLVALLSVVLGALLTGCGGGDASSPPAEKPAAGTNAPAAK